MKQHKYQTLFCTGMMDSYLLLLKKTRIVFFSGHFFFSSLFTGKRTKRGCWGYCIYKTHSWKL